jgi:hypothetical protein
MVQACMRRFYPCDDSRRMQKSGAPMKSTRIHSTEEQMELAELFAVAPQNGVRQSPGDQRDADRSTMHAQPEEPDRWDAMFTG